MQSFDTAAAIASAPNTVTDPQLRQLLIDRIQSWTTDRLLKLTHLVLVEAVDTEATFVDAIGLSPVANPLDVRRFGDAEFVCPFDIVTDHGGHFELMMTVGNDGFAFVIFVPDRKGVDPALLAMCHAHARR